MAFDSGFLAASLHEISSFAGVSRVEKIHQPRNDEITLSLRSKEGTRTLLLRCGAQDPRIVFTSSKRENPPGKPDPAKSIVQRGRIRRSRLRSACCFASTFRARSSSR